MTNCPQCGGDLKYSQRLKRYYCDDCGYRVSSLEETKQKEEKLTIEETEEKNNLVKLREKVDKDYIIDCPHCGGELVIGSGKILCKVCSNEYKVKEKINLFEKKEIKKDKFNLFCPKCRGEYGFDETSGKIACQNCGYQPAIENKEYIIDKDKSEIKTIECDKCGSNSGYKIVEGKMICKSCHSEIEVLKPEIKKIIARDGIVAKNLEKKSVKCKNCGKLVEGFDFYKTELCPNCGTINIVIEDKDSLRLEPDKIIFFTLKREEVLEKIKEFEKLKGVKITFQKKPKKVYIPFWHFHLEGAKVWFKKKYSYEDKTGFVRSIDLDEGVEEIPLPEFWISAMNSFENNFNLEKISLDRAENYSPEILDTYTERYNVGTTEADVIVNDEVYEYLYDIVWNKKQRLRFFKANFMDLKFGTYKKDFLQILLPFWEGICLIKNNEYFFTMSDLTGKIVIYGLEE